MLTVCRWRRGKDAPIRVDPTVEKAKLPMTKRQLDATLSDRPVGRDSQSGPSQRRRLNKARRHQSTLVLGLG